jgi:tetratricopeptide (TPR) repeat protein
MFSMPNAYLSLPGRLVFRQILIALIVICAIGNGVAVAQNTNETAEVQRLLRAGQLEQALQRADTFLASKPRDAQMRFLKGLIFTEQKKNQEAINVFQKLSEDFPELPEPHNNLAVLYAAQGQYDKARAALELAIRTDPRYATAYENLGDVYAKLASQAYDRALQLDNSNNLASSKLSLIKDMIGGTQAQLPTRTPVATGTTAPSRPLTPITPAPTAAPPIVKPEPSKPEPKSEPAKVEAPKAEPSKTAPTNDTEDILKAVRQWAAAWSRQDIDAYIGAYGRDFKPSRGLTRAQWEAERRARINGRAKIRVEVLQPRVSITGDTAKVSFRQNYESDSLETTTRKTLTLTRQGNRWLIVSEITGA